MAMSNLDLRMVVIPRRRRCVKVLSSTSVGGWVLFVLLPQFGEARWFECVSNDVNDLLECDCEMEFPEATFFMRLFPDATLFMLPSDVDRFILGSKLAKSCVDLNICCSSQCFCMILPSSTDN